MPEITLNSNEVQDLFFGESDLKIIHESEWEQDHKSQYKLIVFEKDEKFYSVTAGRSGSPFSDWYYDWEHQSTFECAEVHEVEITTKVWRVV